jgi:hypothetical protein
MWEDQFHNIKTGCSGRTVGTIEVMKLQFQMPGCRLCEARANGFAPKFQAFVNDIMQQTRPGHSAHARKTGIDAELPEALGWRNSMPILNGRLPPIADIAVAAETCRSPRKSAMLQ